MTDQPVSTEQPTTEQPAGSILTPLIVGTNPYLAVLADIVKYWWVIVIAGLMIVAGIEWEVIKHKNNVIATMTSNVVVTDLQLTNDKNEITKYKATIADDKTNLEKASKQSQDIQDTFDTFKKTFNKNLIDAYKKANDINNEVTPKDCNQALEFLQKHLKDNP